MCNRFFQLLRNLWIPTHIKKEIEELHEERIRWLWNEIYDKFFIIGETRTREEFIIRFPLTRIYEIDGYWKKYNYKIIDFGFYIIKLNEKMNYSYEDIPISLDFYSDGNTGFLELARTA